MQEVRPHLRAVAYKTLALLYEYPEKDIFINSKERSYICNIFSELSKNNYFQDLTLVKIEELFSSIQCVPLEELQAEYIRLFEYAPLCPPYETAYINSNASDTLLSLQELYKKFGVQTNFPYPADFLIFQVEFMSYLISLEDTLSQKEFLERHLKVWIEHFSKCIKAHSFLAFYKLLAQLTLIFIRSDFLYLSKALL